MITQLKTNSFNIFEAKRLLFFADDGRKKTGGSGKGPEKPEVSEARRKSDPWYGDKALEAACAGEKEFNPLLFSLMQDMNTPGQLEMRKEFLTKMKNVSRMKDKLAMQSNKEAIQELYYEKVKILKRASASDKPTQELIKDSFKEKEKKDSVDLAIQLKIHKVPQGIRNNLINALNSGWIIPERFNEYALYLIQAGSEERNLLLERLGNSRTSASFQELGQEMTLLRVKGSNKEREEDSVARGGQLESKAAVKDAMRMQNPEDPELERQREKKGEAFRAATEGMSQATGKLEAKEKDADAFVHSSGMRVEVKGDAKAKVKLFNENSKETGMSLAEASSEAEMEKASIELVYAKAVKPAIESRGSASKEQIFRSNLDVLKRQAKGLEVEIEIPDASMQVLLRHMYEMDEVNKEVLKHEKVIKAVSLEVKDEVQRKTAAANELLTLRGMTGINIDVSLADLAGYPPKERDLNIKLVGKDENGRKVFITIDKIESIGQRVDTQADLEEHFKDIGRDPKLAKKIGGGFVWYLSGKYEDGKPYDDFHAGLSLDKEVEKLNLVQDFEGEGVEKVHEILKDQDKVKAGLSNEIRKGGRIEHYYFTDEGKEAHTRTLTIQNDPEKDGYIILDQDIQLFSSKNYRDKNNERYFRKAGSKIELAEFTSWLLRENIYEYFEETAETSTDETSKLNEALRKDHEEERSMPEMDGFEMSEGAIQISDIWTIVKSRANGDTYALRRDPEDFNMIQAKKVGRSPGQPLSEDAGEAHQQSLHTFWQAEAVPSKTVSETLKWLRSEDFTLFDSDTEARREGRIQPEKLKSLVKERVKAHFDEQKSRMRKACETAKAAAASMNPFSGGGAMPSFGSSATDRHAPASSAGSYSGSSAPSSTSSQATAASAGAGGRHGDVIPLRRHGGTKTAPPQANWPRYSVEKGELDRAAFQSNLTSDVSAIPADNRTDEQKEIDSIVADAKKSVENGGNGKIDVTMGADPVLHDKDVNVSYPSVSFLSRMWRNTTFLSNNDMFQMGKAMYEYYIRRWERNVKGRYSNVGQNLPYFGTEMERIHQTAETEEVNQFKEAMNDWGIWQIEDELFSTRNRDKAKACFIALSEKGKLRWEDTRVWETLNRLTDSKHHIHIPANGDPQVKDPRTGKTGMELIGPAIDSLWGEGQYNDWYTQNAAKIDSGIKEYDAEGKQLEADPYNNGTVGGRLRQLLAMHKAGEYVDPHEYEGLVHFIINAGKSDVANKLYFIVEGVAAENARGQTILTMDRIGSINGLYLNRLPWLDFLTKRDVQRANGDTTGWQRSDFQAWIKEWDANSYPGKENSADKNKVIWDFIWKNVLNDNKTIVRTNKGLRNAQDMDHDDAHFIIPLANETTVTDALSVSGGNKKYFTYEGYANAIPGYSELLKGRMSTHKPNVGLISDTVKSFVRYDAVLQNRLFRSEGTRLARLDSAYLRKPSVVSSIPTGVHRDELVSLVKEVCNAYNYSNTDLLFKFVKQDKAHQAEQEEVEGVLKDFGKDFDTMIKSDGGQRLMTVVKNYIDRGGLTGLDPMMGGDEFKQAMEKFRDSGEDLLAQH